MSEVNNVMSRQTGSCCEAADSLTLHDQISAKERACNYLGGSTPPTIKNHLYQQQDE